MATPTQGLIKMAKGRAALANVLNNDNSQQVLALTPKKTGQGTWEQKALSVRTWMKSNPLKLGIPNDGTLETIQQQLTRGDKHHGARQKCWDHILLELSSCGVEGLGGVDTKKIISQGRENANPRLEVDEANPDPASSPSDDSSESSAPNSSGSNSSIGGAGSKAVFALRASAESLANVMAAEEVVKKEEEVVLEVAGGLSVEVPALSNQTLEHIKQNVGVMAPQSKSARPAKANDHIAPGVPSMESLSARGAGKISSFNEMDQKDKVKAKEEGDASGAGSKPLTMMERQELWMAKKKAKTDAKKAAAEAALVNSISSHPDNSKSKKSLGLVRAKAEAEKAALQKIAKEQALVKEQAKIQKEKEKKEGAGGSKWSLVKNATKVGKKAGKKKVAAAKAKEDKKTEKTEKTEEGSEAPQPEAVIFSPTTAMAKRRNSCSDVEAFPIETQTGSGVSEAGVVSSSSTPNLKDAKATFVPGSFFSRVDPSTRRGHFRVRDGSGFTMNSMYRKRDKYSKRGSAVALLVGTEEKGYEEKVIEVLFDTEKLGEEEAFEWWKENEGRFKSPKKE
ncbi:hypothetical protein TrVE_jg3275 [Triparma verrucosa]|uniref:Uncharacterized protein n=1 Tax=Triparma verrucosa TaxID=1606542 RepID=A0A9W7BIS3_9STRA|nr:hypothetical protein TrVE_jg3275 [Triparma verrucosa]